MAFPIVYLYAMPEDLGHNLRKLQNGVLSK